MAVLTETSRLIIWKRIMTAMEELTRVRGDGERLN
jgi:hypothetical protein